MSDTSKPAATKLPIWFWLGATFGLAWNLFGVAQFVQSLQSTPESLMKMGMSAAHAQTYASYPAWMTVAFAIGVFAGLLGCVFLLARKRLATLVFGASLAGYIVLYIGDITEGVFAALGSQQVAVLTTVVLIAAALCWFSWRFERQGSLA